MRVSGILTTFCAMMVIATAAAVDNTDVTTANSMNVTVEDMQLDPTAIRYLAVPSKKHTHRRLVLSLREYRLPRALREDRDRRPGHLPAHPPRLVSHPNCHDEAVVLSLSSITSRFKSLILPEGEPFPRVTVPLLLQPRLHWHGFLLPCRHPPGLCLPLHLQLLLVHRRPLEGERATNSAFPL